MKKTLLYLLVLAVLIRLPDGWKADWSPLIVFGQTPLFYYLAHFYFLMMCGFLFFREAGSIGDLYLMWVVTLVVLYPVCAVYRRFKLGKPRESLWRML